MSIRTSKPDSVMETWIENEILQYLGGRPDVLCYKSKAARVQDMRGVWHVPLPIGCPDITGCLKGGRAFYVEVKRVGGELRSEQKVFRKRCLELGVLHIVARSLQDVTDAFREAGIDT